MADLTKLKAQILDLIKDENYDPEDLKKILEPVSTFIDNPLFADNLQQIVDIVTKDRDGNNKFTIDDLKIMSHDVMAVTSLISCLLLVIQAIPELKLQYDAGATEEIIFKLLTYIFLVVVPKQTNQKWTVDEKTQIVNLSITIYQLVQSTGIVQDLYEKLKKLLATKVFTCSCFKPKHKDPADTIAQHMPKAKLELITHMNNVKDKAKVERLLNQKQ